MSLNSYARENGIEPERTEIDLANYLTSSINDIAPFDEADGYATCITERPAPQPPGQAAVRCDWRITVNREAWQQARGIGRQAVRPDLLAHLVRELYSLPSVCDTDAVMTAVYTVGRGQLKCSCTPDGRKRADRYKEPRAGRKQPT
ncbi:hypothetical protein [Streptomyces sp. OR43]|uniref:hypothetical protein n=1 Tax=Streptomyces sp. or43 TaxID=2478957 RepID=UPI0011CE2A63|nr:hypothetical protein [Streptomyces sp. or43]TXS44934.1 hypothetical protein EAO72_07890 [Streptomyces sp. or43]